ncbi:UTP--glucose-1-phosphate uridylyltransferase GalU [Blochmannia endosymbiont of Polyrhachis (Hedomyrma) turneri]|uniref:UTP--glucose-1-phosphate uridylyltransferase GalU n=1 Tax=Blochmannia endosymbiont of Polyrhachis (Hedomyrma) turneri TaxID=1505596 RepID=UPI00061A67FC|nr:UTP--glucose-1-phosphate uridylyltransferase GalU [Blochmannia endosymbiont of Polyrhachis (Hedomyrma) turneri]AKC59998.1 UTP--glucose-1-phosphate uridylyltransferase [Blochmannia endosymbiont of Polyrhachis (Hedomyrma) turneri]
MSTLSCKVEKAVIPVAGLGTRMLPATKAIPKEMLPLVDTPLIQFVVNECITSGIYKIILVTHSSKNSIENHFDTSFELETILEKRVKRQLLSEIQEICPPNVTIMQVRQGFTRGLGHAISCAHPLVGNEPVAIVLPDVIINNYQSNVQTDNLSAMLDRFSQTGYSQILVKYVSDIKSYGVVNCRKDNLKPGNSIKILEVVEKPNVNFLFSNLSMVGRYVLSSSIWSLLKKTEPGVGNEIQLTDAIAMLIKQEVVEAYCLKGLSYDCGDKFGYMQAFVDYGLKHKQLGEKFKLWLKNNVI